MEKTSIVILGDNIVSNILKFLLKKAGVNFINVALPGKPHSKRYFAIKPSFIDWFSKTLDFKLAESYLIKKIKIFFNEELIELDQKQSPFRSLFHIICSDSIFKTIHEKLDSSLIRVDNIKDVEFESECKKMTLPDKEVDYELIINTDFNFNPLFTIEERNTDFKEHAIVASFSSEADMSNEARQYFFDEKILAVLPNSSNEFSIVFSCKEDEFIKFMNFSDQEFTMYISSKTCLEKIKLLDKRNSYPLKASQAKSTYGDRFILIGDAAHKIHPLAGQGLNLGLDDVKEFYEAIVDGNYRDYGQRNFIRDYSITRKHRVAFIYKLTKLIDGMMVQSKFFSPLVRFCSKFVNRLNFLKQLIVRTVI